ncbi:MAG TPA: M90 family metallopeptidase [Acidimicrobiales bacterium]
MFSWTRTGRVRRALAQPFPDPWRRLLESSLVHWGMLDVDERTRMEDLIRVFLAAKRWQAARDFELTEDIRVLISAMACLLILGLDETYYDTVNWIEVHPTTVVRTGLRGTAVAGVVSDSPLPILGEASFDGPVVIAWDTASVNARHPERGHNVVYHEFAHKLDMGDRLVDGTPRFVDPEGRQRWIEVCTAEFDQIGRGEGGPLLDPYAGVNPAEFFAVVTEVFFDRPVDLERAKPELYGVLQSFYHQDPAARERANGGGEARR